MSDSDSARPVAVSRASSGVAKPPGAQTAAIRRRAGAAASTVEKKPNSSRAAGAGGSSNTMLKLYTDDSPGLRVYVSLFKFAPFYITPFAPTQSAITSICSYFGSSVNFN
ncbi:hypothetical protein HWV62_3963 [Athelia sp. TMB]|nr:hypothetical protein HWV62_3963 [Athelia sp. TMB]